MAEAPQEQEEHGNQFAYVVPHPPTQGTYSEGWYLYPGHAYILKMLSMYMSTLTYTYIHTAYIIRDTEAAQGEKLLRVIYYGVLQFLS